MMSGSEDSGACGKVTDAPLIRRESMAQLFSLERDVLPEREMISV